MPRSSFLAQGLLLALLGCSMPHHAPSRAREVSIHVSGFVQAEGIT